MFFITYLIPITFICNFNLKITFTKDDSFLICYTTAYILYTAENKCFSSHKTEFAILISLIKNK